MVLMRIYGASAGHGIRNLPAGGGELTMQEEVVNVDLMVN